jgi:hypothetical protein
MSWEKHSKAMTMMTSDSGSLNNVEELFHLVEDLYLSLDWA